MYLLFNKRRKSFYQIHENLRISQDYHEKKKLLLNLYIVKNISKLQKINTKGDFQCLYVPVILTDSVYRRDENYYPNVVLLFY